MTVDRGFVTSPAWPVHTGARRGGKIGISGGVGSWWGCSGGWEDVVPRSRKPAEPPGW